MRRDGGVTVHRSAWFVLGFLIVSLAGTGLAQDVPEGAAGSLPARPVERLGAPPQPGEGLEAAITGLGYRLGPGDDLSIIIWSPQPIVHYLSVTLEGNLLIPYVGEIDVNNQLLADAKAHILAELLRHYRNVEVSITLVGLRRFQVHVLGQVRSPGAYMATAAERISLAISRAGDFLGNASQRRILIENGDTLRTEADLFSFLRGGVRATNPFLSDGDRIFVPFAEDFIQVVGEVNAPGRIQYLAKDRLSDAILLSGGFTASSFLDTLEIARYPQGSTDPIRFFVVDGGGLFPAVPEEIAWLPRTLETFSPPDQAVPLGSKPVYMDIALEPNDLIFVRQIPEIRLRRLVEIQGEVQFSGAYPIQEGRTRLSDLVAMAGGLTSRASLSEAKLVRRGAVGLEDPEFERLKKIPVADLHDEEYGYFKMKSREAPGRMVVNIEEALLHGAPNEDILLERGDLVIIPTRKGTVSLLGMVARPGNVQYRPGLEARDYIRGVGGFAQDANKGGSRVIKARTGEWVRPGDAGTLEPGDVVFVPQKEPRDWWRLFRETLTAAAQLAAIYLVFDSAVSN
jgi:protein involved in polysaccharide export with SLBB domain